MSILSALPPAVLPASLGLSSEVFPSFRPNQLEVASQIALSESRFPLLNMPTGSGKSLTVVTAAKLLGLRLLILTPQLAHQDQYLRDFGGSERGDLVDVRGQSHYSCPRFGNCEVGAANECPFRKSDGSATQRCPNVRAIDSARGKDLVVTNHAFWMTQGRAREQASQESGPPPGIGTFDMIAIDEGHGIPERLADFCAIELIEPEIERLFEITFPSSSSSLGVWSSWALEALRGYSSALRDVGFPKERQRVIAIGRALGELASISTDLDTRWIYQHDRENQRHTFTPVWATRYAESLLFQGTPKVALISATLLPSIGKYLGIDPTLSTYLDIGNTFESRNRPFIFTLSGVEVKHKSMQNPSNVRVLAAKMDQILDLWKGYKGLIHTQSYDLQEKVIAASRNRARFILCQRGGLSGAEAVRRLKASHRDEIAVGPGLKEGHDLADDSARFQIILKMPQVNQATDQITKARCESISTYAMDRLAIDVLQMTGRITRSREDWGYTYCPDDSFKWIRKKITWPQSFESSIRMEWDKVPGPPKGK